MTRYLKTSLNLIAIQVRSKYSCLDRKSRTLVFWALENVPREKFNKQGNLFYINTSLHITTLHYVIKFEITGKFEKCAFVGMKTT